MKGTGPRREDDKALGHLLQSNMKVVARMILNRQILTIFEFCMVWPMILLLIRLSHIAKSTALINTLFCDTNVCIQANRFNVDRKFVATEGSSPSLTNDYVNKYISGF